MEVIKKLKIVIPVANKKIRNSTPNEYNGIKFKSRLEVMLYKVLVSSGFTPNYEKIKFTLWEGYYPTVPFFERGSNGFAQNKKKLIDITYTPDFTFTYKQTLIVIEAKGIENDVFPVKKKLFRKKLEEAPYKALYFEIRTKRELLQAIDIIRKHEYTIREDKQAYDCSSQKRHSDGKKISRRKRSKLPAGTN